MVSYRILGCWFVPLLLACDDPEQMKTRKGGLTVSNGRHKTVDWHWPVEDHPLSHGLLSHKIAYTRSSISSKCATRPYLSTRASDVKPAIAMPTWSSIRNIFCWYEANSPVERCVVSVICICRLEVNRRPSGLIIWHVSLIADQLPRILASRPREHIRLDEDGLEEKRRYYPSRRCF